MFIVAFQNKAGVDLATAQGLLATPLWYSKSTRGGCLAADIEVVGKTELLWSLLSLVAQRVIIRNPDGQPVWWGLVEDVIINRGSLSDGLSIRNMYNRIRVAYVYEEQGELTTAYSEWGTHAESIRRLGITKELLETQEIPANPEVALARRDTLLGMVGLPVPITEDSSSGSEAARATIKCAGDFSEFEWKYYEQLSGLEEHTAGGAEQVMGQQVVGPMGFRASGVVADIQGELNAMRSGTWVRIAGAVLAANNRDKVEVIGTDDREYLAIPTDNLLFVADDSIWVDVNDELAFEPDMYKKDDIVASTGIGVNNNKFWWVVWTVPDHMKVTPIGIELENNPAGGTLYRGNTVTLEGGPDPEDDFAREMLSGDVTMSVHGLQVAQSFRLASTVPWTLAAIELNMARVGTPIDAVTVEIRTDNAGVPGTLITASSIAPSAFGLDMTGERWEFSNTTTLATNTTYWLVIRRAGDYHPKNFYLIDVDEGATYGRGSMKVWDNVGWVDRDPNASLHFRLLGAWETTKQIREIVAATGQYVTKLDMAVNSGIYSNQTRNGEGLAIDELAALLDAGTISGQALMAEVTMERILRIQAVPAVDATVLIEQTEFGSYKDQLGRPLADGFLPVGRWIVRPDVPSGVAQHYRMSPRLCIEAEYDCKANRIRRMRYLGAPTTAEVLGI